MDAPNQTNDQILSHTPDPSMTHSQPPHSPQKDSRKRDPGTPISGLVALVFAILMAGGVILWQNLPIDTQYGLFGAQAPETPINAETAAPGRFAEVDLGARIIIRGRTLFRGSEASVMGQFAVAYTPEDQVRTIIMSGEYEGAEEALTRIETTRLELRSRLDDIGGAEDGEVIEADGFVFEELDEAGDREATRLGLVFDELDALESIYEDGPSVVEQSMQDQLIDRYGVLGQAALVYGVDDDDPTREPIVTGFVPIMLLMILVILVVGLSILAGFVLLILGIVNFATGNLKLRFKAPAAGGSVFLETYGIFVAGFAVLSIGLFALSITVSEFFGIVSLPMQWILILVPLWALFRGMKYPDWKEAIGFHRGEGIMKEIACGFLAYLASIPVFLVGVLITIIVLIIQGMIATASGAPIEPPTNPIFDLLSDGGFVIMFLIFTLATIWAPIAEELIFRGALHRHMRGRLHWVFAGFFSALLFAYMHSYGPFMVAPLIALGFMFSFMREWRGSIIAPITAHFIHNASLVGFMIVLITLLKDPVIS